MNKTKDLARGKWFEILHDLNILESWLSNKHAVCPFCGKTKYRYTNVTNNGDWICTCGFGNGFNLVQQHYNCNFKTAASMVDKTIGRKYDTQEADKQRIKLKNLQTTITNMWNYAKNPAIVSTYLKKRGLIGIPNTLKGYDNLYYEGDTYPAMLAQVKKVNGDAIAIHRTLMLPDYRKIKRLTSGLEPLSGSAIQLYPADEDLGIAEGIETAIAAYKLFGIPVWSCISAGLMSTIEIPAGVKRVTVFSDNDKNYTGQAAAFKLANRIVLRDKLECKVMIPAERGDWLDVYLKEEVDKG